MKHLLLIMSLILTHSFSAVAANSESSAENDADRDADTLACISPDASESDPSWEVFERAIPACKRAILTLKPNSRLDLGEKKVMKSLKTGITILRATVVTAKGFYDVDERVKNIDEGVLVWLSMDRCDVRRALLEDEKGRSVESLKSARYLIVTEELSGIAHGDQLPGYKDDCRR